MITLYGISNCDSMRKSGKWLDSQNIEWSLHDYRKHGIDHALAAELLAVFGSERLINKRGTTWRQLPADQQARIADPAATVALIQAYPALIKRPVVRSGTQGWALGYEELTNLSG